MQPFTLCVITLGIPFEASTFDAPGAAHALCYGSGYVNAMLGLRPDFEVGARYRLDRVLIRRKRRIMDNTTFVAECEVLERDGEIRAIWRVPASPPEADKQ